MHKKPHTRSNHHLISFALAQYQEREESLFCMTIYRKPTFTGVYLNWRSLTSRTYKIGLVKCLLNRAWSICTNYELFHLEVINIKSILRKNDYPCRVIDSEIKKFIDRKFVKKARKEVENVELERRKVYLVLPYQNKLVDQFKEKIEALVDKFYKDVEFRVMFTCPRTIGSHFVFKDKVPPELRSMVVYRIKCKTCSASYIGKTERCLIRRMDEHKKGRGSGECISSCFKHSKLTGHEMDYQNIEVLDRANTHMKILLKEMLHIQREKPTLNVQKGSSLFTLILGKSKRY